MKEQRQTDENPANNDKLFAGFIDSFKIDRRLFDADIRVNIAYCDALFHAGILNRQESQRITNGLQIILKRAEFDRNYFKEFPASDIHAFVESRLVQLVGDVGRKLQTGKSLHDQIATTFRLWLRKEIEEIAKLTTDLQKTLVEIADGNNEAILPAYAHFKKIQPILWAHWCLAYFEMFVRDLERLDEVWRRVNVLPFGSGDLAGTSFEIDREEIARNLGFEGISSNSLDAVSDRDFAVEFINACALLMIHLSRLSEDLLLYSSDEFGFIKFDNENIKNEIALELIRAKAGRIFGHQTALLTTLKSLPIGVNKDLQESKEAVFDTIETLEKCLKILSSVLRNLYVNEVKTRNSAKQILNSDELENYLVNQGVDFGTAKDIVGKIVSFAKSTTKKLNELSLSELQSFSSEFEKDVSEIFNLEQILAGKNQIGGTSPETVREALEMAKNDLEIDS
jgi:argininosuccinate lyase